MASSVALAALLWPAGALGDWSPVQAGQLNSAGSSVGQVAAADVDGVPYIAWSESEADDATQMLVAALGAGVFSRVGGALPSATLFSGLGPSSIAAVGGRAYLAYGNDGSIEIFSWSGSSWGRVGAEGEVKGSPGASAGVTEGPGGTPYLAFVAPSSPEKIQVDAFSSSTHRWSQVGAQLLGKSGDVPGSVSLLGDGAAPIVAWEEVEPNPGNPAEYEGYVFADQLSGGAFSPLDDGHPLNLTAGPNPASGPVLAMVGSTPYLAFDEEERTIARPTNAAYGFALSGSSFERVGATIASDPGELPAPALGELEGAPLAITLGELSTGEDQPAAETFRGGSWSELGGALGVPPLPGSSGDPYGGHALAVAGGIPYVALLQQPPDTEAGEENLFVEDYTANGVNPLRPFEGVEYPPQVTGAESSAGTASSSSAQAGSTTQSTAQPIAAAATLELAGAARLTRHGHSLGLDSGVTASCPHASGSPDCKGSVVLQVAAATGAGARAGAARGAAATIRVSVPFAVASGHEQVVAVQLSKPVLARLRAPRTIHGTLTVTITGPNARSTALAQSLSARLP